MSDNEALELAQQELAETKESYRKVIEDLRQANADLRRLADATNLARQQAEQRADELAALNRVASALTNVTDLRASLQIAARELTQVFNTRGSTVTLIDEARQHAEVVAEYFTDPTLPSVLGLPVPLEVPAWKLLDEQRTAIIIDRPQENEVLGSVRDVMRQRAVAQLLVAPLLSRGVLIGNMSVSHEPGRAFSPSEVMLAQTLAGPVAQAVESARLFNAAERARETAEAANQELARLSVTDAVTGLPNRRLFHEVIDSEWRRAQGVRASMAVLMIDIDFFKPYNDEYGHQQGDACLAIVARAIQKALHRAGDFVARYGGEEFVVILPNADELVARTLGERICQLVRALAIPHAKSAAASVVTVSVGCVARLPSLDTLPATLIASADQALYEAKRDGRNRVICASET